MNGNKNAIVLCSGGLDSVTTAFYVKYKLKYGYIIILFFNYGQRALTNERKCAYKCSKKLKARFLEITLPGLRNISNSLINKKGSIKRINYNDLKDTKKESEKYYVPCRNTIFLAYALALAEAEFIKTGKRNDIFVGFKCEGKDSYPDTTLKFLNSINKLSKISTKGFKVYAPLIKKDKEDIIVLAKKLEVNFKNTFSCYAPINNKSCGYCLSCQLRKAGFYWANIQDI